MRTARELQTKRLAARIPGQLLASKIKISRSRLSGIENGYVAVAPEELAHIENAIDVIVAERQRIADLAEREGLSLAGVGL